MVKRGGGTEEAAPPLSLLEIGNVHAPLWSASVHIQLSISYLYGRTVPAAVPVDKGDQDDSI
jgi:hypothetical protein